MLAQEWHKVPPHDGYDRLGTVYEARGENRQPADCYRKVIWLIRSAEGLATVFRGSVDTKKLAATM
jgi:hypothetical protein